MISLWAGLMRRGKFEVDALCKPLGKRLGCLPPFLLALVLHVAGDPAAPCNYTYFVIVDVIIIAVPILVIYTVHTKSLDTPYPALFFFVFTTFYPEDTKDIHTINVNKVKLPFF